SLHQGAWCLPIVYGWDEGAAACRGQLSARRALVRPPLPGHRSTACPTLRLQVRVSGMLAAARQDGSILPR
ncbi:MAG: hypothetical protein M3380_02940, partial [Chloroflexota bacterium]|nr:hypothetical protein [Chloroflexota bacterium]